MTYIIIKNNNKLSQILPRQIKYNGVKTTYIFLIICDTYCHKKR